MPNRPQPAYISVSDAAEHVDVHAKTIRRWIAAGKLPAYRFGGTAIRIKVTDLENIARRIPHAAA